MRAVVLQDGEYRIAEAGRPVPAAGEVLIKVSFAGVNRADLYQKQGRYPLPEKNPAVPGLEVSGVVVSCGGNVTGITVGDDVCALLGEGAFAEYAAVPAPLVMKRPASVTVEEGAALAEACYTAWVSLVWQAKLAEGETVLIHGGASGVGNMAVQMARVLRAKVFATAGTEEKCAACTEAGAYAINHTKEDFVAVIKRETQGRGVDVILDMVGGDYFARNLDALVQGGRLCIIAFIKGARADASLSPVLLKHLSVMGSTLRARSTAEKARIAKELQERIWPFLGQKGGIKPMISRVFPLEEAEKALAFMEKGLNIGKILLKI